ncbi:MAG TPA: DNA polymerase III subunit gamma and tau, partial [Microlunatus sp.]|nr:DNA polymerase III subunit gamma and tau [Microlunatus sp.]
ALGVDFRIEAIVDPSVTSGGRAGGGGGAARGGGQRVPAGLAEAEAPPEPEPPEEIDRSGPGADRETKPPTVARAKDGAGPAEWSEVAAVPGAPATTGAASHGEDPAGGPAGTPPVDPRWREQARQHIRPTRQGPAPAEGGSEDLRDEAASINDSDIEDQEESHTELLARQLGAEIIGEEKHGF